MENPSPAGIAPGPAPDPVKTPSPLVIPLTGAAAALLGSLLGGLLLGGCTSEEGPLYDIPVSQRIQSAVFEADSDGAPVILAEVAMYYGTHDKLKEWEPKYEQSNNQSVLFAKRNGAWSPLPFRNLRNPNWASSMLVRNASGAIQPMIWDRRKLTLYGRSGSDWVPRSIVRLEEDDRYGMVISYSAESPRLALVGDSAWESVGFPTRDKALRVSRSDGTFFALDTAEWFQPLAFHSGRAFNLMVGMNTTYGPMESHSTTALYRWNLDRDHPDVRKQVLPELSYEYSEYFSSVAGEPRLYARSRDSVLVYAERGGEWVIIQTDFIQAYRNSDRDTLRGSMVPTFNLQPDPDGCMQGTALSYSDGGFGADYRSKPVFLYASTCSQDVDTIPLPGELENVPGYPQFSGPRFTRDGRPMLLLTLQKTAPAYSDEGDIKEPSWIYLATRNPSGTWEWELVAKY